MARRVPAGPLQEQVSHHSRRSSTSDLGLDAGLRPRPDLASDQQDPETPKADPAEANHALTGEEGGETAQWVGPGRRPTAASEPWMHLGGDARPSLTKACRVFGRSPAPNSARGRPGPGMTTRGPKMQRTQGVGRRSVPSRPPAHADSGRVGRSCRWSASGRNAARSGPRTTCGVLDSGCRRLNFEGS